MDSEPPFSLILKWDVVTWSVQRRCPPLEGRFRTRRADDQIGAADAVPLQQPTATPETGALPATRGPCRQHGARSHTGRRPSAVSFAAAAIEDATAASVRRSSVGAPAISGAEPTTAGEAC